jgi:hypothetical protein
MLIDSPRSNLAGGLIPGLDSAMLVAAQQPRLSLFWGTQTPTKALLAMFTLFGVQGLEPRLFDGGNRFDGYFVARLARRLTPQPRQALSKMHLSRAFTCFQLAELIEHTPAREIGEPHGGPLFVLDLLSTFYDESVPLRDVERLLGVVITHLKRLAVVGPVVVGAREPESLVKDRWGLLHQLQDSADTTWMLRPPPGETNLQPRLF